MSKMSRDAFGPDGKGGRIEREIVSAHGALGIKAERVPLSGATRHRGNGSDPDLNAYAACSLAAERPLSKPITAARS
jgi:Holliday junction resolvase